jgi:hypothetical protein
MPHIHGVAWISKACLKMLGFGNGFLCDGEDDNVIKLADKLLSCRLPEPQEVTPLSSKEEKEQIEHENRLRKIVSEVQKHKHTESCLKYNGSCRYHFPRLPTKRTILAQPRKVKSYENEMQKMEAEEVIAKEDKRNADMLGNAYKALCDKNLEQNIKREVIKKRLCYELKDIDDRKVTPKNANLEKKILRKFAQKLYVDRNDLESSNFESIYDEALEEFQNQGEFANKNVVEKQQEYLCTIFQVHNYGN